jgi:tetratricopeptide (TPR) repeat protein
MRRGEIARWMGFAILAAVVALAWSNGLHGEFTYDDKVEVIGNRTIRVLDNHWAILSYNFARPLLIATYALNFHFSGFEPFAYHVVDVALQIVNAGLVLLLVSEAGALLGRGPAALRAALVVAGIWALHPLSTEAVSYVTGRSEQLCATFYLLAGWLWLRFLQEGGAGRWVGAHLAFLAAAFTKEVAATAPIALFLLEWLAARGGRLKAVRWHSYTLFALLLVAGALGRWHLAGSLLPRESERPWDVHLWTQLEVVWTYLRLWLVPAGQTVFHDFPETGATLRSVAAGLGLLGLTGAALWGRQRAPLLALGWLWFLVLLVPSSGAPLKETMAEHRPYLASLGLAWVLGDSLARRRWGLPATLGLWLVLGVLTMRRNTVWASEVALWEEAVDRSPESAEAWYGYGDALRFADRWSDARVAYRQSVDLDPTYIDSWNNLALCNAELGRDSAAIAAFKDALTRSPSSCRTHTNFGLFHIRRGRYAKGEAELRTALTYCPHYCEAFYFLGSYYQEIARRPAEAQAEFELLLKSCPDSPRVPEVQQRLLDLTF